NLTLAGTNETRTLTATPTPGQIGNATLSLTVQNAPCGLSVTTNLVARVVTADPSFSMPDAALSNSVWLATGQPADALTSVDLLNLPSLTLANLQFTNL